MSIAQSHHDNTRRCVDYTPTIWGNMFLPYASDESKVFYAAFNFVQPDCDT